MVGNPLYYGPVGDGESMRFTRAHHCSSQEIDDNLVGSVIGWKQVLASVSCSALGTWGSALVHRAPPDRVGHWAGMWPWRRVGGLTIPAAGEWAACVCACAEASPFESGQITITWY